MTGRVTTRLILPGMGPAATAEPMPGARQLPGFAGPRQQ